MNNDDLKERASLLPEALQAAGHPAGATGLARLAAQRGFAPATTVAALEAAGHQPAAQLARVMLGSAAFGPGEKAAPQTPSQQMSAAIRARYGIGPDADQAA